MKKDELISKLDALIQETIDAEARGDSISTPYRLRTAGRIFELLSVSCEQGYTSEVETLVLTASLALKLAKLSLEASLVVEAGALMN